MRVDCIQRAVAGVLALGVLGAAPRAFAQACCIAPGAWGQGRLSDEESWLAGLSVRAQRPLGTFDASGAYRPAPTGTHELSLEQHLFSTARLARGAEMTLDVPFVETWRTVTGARGAGGGLGDIGVGLRWTVVRKPDAYPWPALGLTGSATLPTGTPPESASDPVGAGATGTGATQLALGVTLEQARGPWFGALNGGVAWRAPREVLGVESHLAPQISVALVGGHAWVNGAAASLTVAHVAEGDANVSGMRVPNSARRLLTATAALQLRLGEGWRTVGQAWMVPPVGGVGAGDSAVAGASVAVVRGWP